MPFLLGVIVIVAVLGMPLMLATPMIHHEMGCPFAMGETAMCSMSVFDHIRNWQIAFAAIFAELLMAALVLVALRQWELLTMPEPQCAYVHIRSRAPDKPTLFQELFSRGILNRQEHFHF